MYSEAKREMLIECIFHALWNIKYTADRILNNGDKKHKGIKSGK